LIGLPAFPLAHLGHWASLLYALPVIILIIWAAVAKLLGSRRKR